jgi:hypothetical protein
MINRRARVAVGLGLLCGLACHPARGQDQGEPETPEDEVPVLEAEAEAAPAPPPGPRPEYQFLRYREDWSVLRDMPADQKTDFWDPIKYIPLNEDGSWWASFGASARLRVESWWNYAFGPNPANEDTYLLWRLLLHGDYHFGENLRLFVEGINAVSTPRTLPGGTRTVDVDTLDLEQLFVDFRVPFSEDVTLTVRPGRQQFIFGKQRLVSPLGWSNTLRRWQGVDAILEAGEWDVNAFWTRYVPVQKYAFNTAAYENQFYGVYATGPLADSGVGLDLYFLGLENQNPRTFNGTTGSERRFTVGGRLFGEFPGTPIDYDFEGAYQFGSVGPGDVSAFMIGSQFGYKVPEWWSDPRFFLGFDFGSGDRSPGGNVQTFNQLYPLGHAYLGYIDTIGRQNIMDLSLGVTAKPTEKLAVVLTGHLFWRPEAADALYNAGGNVVRPGAVGTSREVGQEIDLAAWYQFDRHWSALVGYSHFFAGQFIGETGPSNDINFVYVEVTYTF